jgi:hypothetical protein
MCQLEREKKKRGALRDVKLPDMLLHTLMRKKKAVCDVKKGIRERIWPKPVISYYIQVYCKGFVRRKVQARTRTKVRRRRQNQTASLVFFGQVDTIKRVAPKTVRLTEEVWTNESVQTHKILKAKQVQNGKRLEGDGLEGNNVMMVSVSRVFVSRLG